MRTISIVVDSRTNWSKARSICESVRAHPDLRLNLAVCGPMSRHWDTQLDGWTPDNVLDTYYDTEHATGFAAVEQSAHILEALKSYYREIRPDVVVALTDRYETLCVAQAATLMNIHVAHVQGGEVTGCIDESIRHAVTKLSHIHFPATEQSAQRIVLMGEYPHNVHNVGCPSIDLLMRVDVSEKVIDAPYAFLLMHPLTTDVGRTYEAVSATIRGLKRSWDGIITGVGPNHDAGYLDVWRAIKDNALAITSGVSFTDFCRLMAHATVVVSNSSAAVRESCYYGVPVVCPGGRQDYREHGSNLYRCPADETSVRIGVNVQKGKSYPIERIYGDGNAGQRIADILAFAELPPIQKKIRY